MNPIAFYSGSIVLYWSGLIISLGILAGFLLSYAIYTAHYESGSAMWVMLPIAIVLSVGFSRAIHWYCHVEQYNGFIGAITDYSAGGYCLPGVIIGTWIAAGIVAFFRIADSKMQLLDAVAPGLCLTIALIRFSALFNYSCRGKMTVDNISLRTLPFASPIVDSSGNYDYRFATFCIEGILLIILTIIMVGFYYRNHNVPMKDKSRRDGNVAKFFLVFLSSIELVMDSTRYDSCFMNFKKSFLQLLNKFASFISVVQLFAAITILIIMIYYSSHSTRGNGHRFYHFLLWVGFLVALGIVGGSEYLVQRYSNMYRIFYTTQSIGAILMAVMVLITYNTCKGYVEEDE